ncbi:hypothetical protein [Streptomyces olivochromogenes]|uniref:hypothetical protein n=1 Tax=Streptomyces olivochromogenes TaxID=1963 RepID=UPI001F1E99F9|nr:hypothetical protein [Streptomyces olivochromogenes]MCF3130031.1 hypothetical protein [Streptomyces olivochromogenes]
MSDEFESGEDLRERLKAHRAELSLLLAQASPDASCVSSTDATRRADVLVSAGSEGADGWSDGSPEDLLDEQEDEDDEN